MKREELYKLGVTAKAQSLLPLIDSAQAIDIKLAAADVAKALDQKLLNDTEIDYTICGIAIGPADVVVEVARLLSA